MIIDKIDTTDKKIGSFIGAIITLIFAGLCAFVCFNLGQTINAQSGLESLSQLVTIPLLIILYVVLSALTVSSAISSVFAIFSTVKAIKIISIFLLLISIAIAVLEIYTLTLVF